MKNVSLDPRFNRLDLPESSHKTELTTQDAFETYEVFHQKKSGAQHSHVGIVHAPNPELALVFAKEQFGRRGATTSLWVVRSSEIFGTLPEDSDIFDSTPEKLHREASEYKSREKIEQYTKEQAEPK